jgi:hypothetical protein
MFSPAAGGVALAEPMYSERIQWCATPPAATRY